MDKGIRKIVLLLAAVVMMGLINLVIQDRVKKSYISLAEIANALAIASQLKVKIETYYFDNGELPNSNYALGIPEPESFQRDGIEKIVIEEAGTIHLVMADANAPQGGHIFIMPKDLNENFSERWLCLTPDYKMISQWAPQCRYQPVEGW